MAIDPLANREVYYVDSNRLGKFNLTFEMQKDRELMGSLFKLMTPVIEAYPHESGRGTTFVAVSELFHQLGEGEEIPQYRLEFDHPSAPPLSEEARRECTKSGAFGWRAIRNNIVRVPPLNINLSPNKVVH